MAQDAARDARFMEEALALAAEAAADGEVPVGAVVVRGEKVLGRGRNRREKGHSALAHAEIEAIRQACEALGDWRLTGCELFVTLEPCPMCAGAILNARLDRVIYGAADKDAGAVGSVIHLFDVPFGHRPRVTTAVLEEACTHALGDFFRRLRAEEGEKSR